MHSSVTPPTDWTAKNPSFDTALDTTTGENGGRVKLAIPSDFGGTTAFSNVQDTASLNVNDASVLTPANPFLGKITDVTTIDLTGTFINNGAGTTTITDVDVNSEGAGLLGGIALTGISGVGTWEYSLNGTTFNPVGTVSAANALLLSNKATLRYTPDPVIGGDATITYRAWDSTDGESGKTADITAANAVGGTTAFSAATDSAKFTVNFAQVLTPVSPSGASLGTTNKDTAIIIPLTGTFINNGTGTTTIEDTDFGRLVIGGIALIGVTGHGTWEYTLDGTNYLAVSTVSNSSACCCRKPQLRTLPTQ